MTALDVALVVSLATNVVLGGSAFFFVRTMKRLIRKAFNAKDPREAIRLILQQILKSSLQGLPDRDRRKLDEKLSGFALVFHEGGRVTIVEDRPRAPQPADARGDCGHSGELSVQCWDCFLVDGNLSEAPAAFRADDFATAECESCGATRQCVKVLRPIGHVVQAVSDAGRSDAGKQLEG